MTKIIGEVKKGIREYITIWSKDPALTPFLGKKIKFRIESIEEVTETPGATVTEMKKV